jgi:hypothetical protein
MKNMVNSHALNIFHEKLEIINKIHPNSLSYSHANLDEAEEEYKGTIIQIVFKNCLDI